MSWSAPSFWRGRGIASTLLLPAAAIYGRIGGRRMAAAPDVVVPVPVVCIGNFVMGGAGKTPVAAAVAEIAARAGRKPVILSRGYGGALRGPLRVDPKKHRADEVGDEPLLLARAAPTVVARDRAAGAIAAARAGAGLLILDDGFQNPALAKDLNLVVVDAEAGIGNGRVFPAGPLRAPLERQMRAAHGLIVLGSGARAAPLVRLAARRGLPVLSGALRPKNPQDFSGRRVLLFSGIGRPEKVAATLRASGAEIAAILPFGDHHFYSEADAAHILRVAERASLLPVTTEKDAVRLAAAASGARRALHAAARRIEVAFAFEDPARMRVLVEETVAAARRRRDDSFPAEGRFGPLAA